MEISMEDSIWKIRALLNYINHRLLKELWNAANIVFTEEYLNGNYVTKKC